LLEIIGDKFDELADFYKSHKLLVSNPAIIKASCELVKKYRATAIENIQTQHIEYIERANAKRSANKSNEPRKKLYYNGLYGKIRKIVSENIKSRVEELQYCTTTDISTPKSLNTYIVNISHKIAAKFKESPEYAENVANWDALPEGLKSPDVIVLDAESIIEMANEVIDIMG
jgi:hypothetical protein